MSDLKTTLSFSPALSSFSFSSSRLIVLFSAKFAFAAHQPNLYFGQSAQPVSHRFRIAFDQALNGFIRAFALFSFLRSAVPVTT